LVENPERARAEVLKELAELEEKVRDKMSRHIRDKSRMSYIGSNIRWIMWLYGKHPELFTPEFVASVPASGITRAGVKAFLGKIYNPDRLPFDFSRLLAKHFTMWLETLKGSHFCSFSLQ
jgi:hypothetical protein